jgi:phosphohistidine phosphatase SixA
MRVHLLRHAKAKNRLEWTEPDELRPLTKRGRREADAIAARLLGDPPGRLVSSPYVRCVETLAPLAAGLDLAIETTDLLAEGADGAEALALLVALARGSNVACCTHGDVVYAIAHSLGLDGPHDVPVASAWELDVSDGLVESARFVEQPPR